MLYFAYGSNMDWDQMRTRCPSAAFVGIARLPDHRLAFTRFSKTRKCGVADVVPAKGQSVWGAVFSIDERDNHLRFRITEAAIIFQHLRPVLRHH